MTENPLQRTLEDRWLELASGLIHTGSRELETLRHIFYAGAASAWNMAAAGESQQLERDVLSFVDHQKWELERQQAAEKDRTDGK